MIENDRILIGYLDDGEFIPLTWDDGRDVYLDDLRREMDERNEKICAFERKYAKVRKPKMFNQSQIEKIKRRRKEGASLRCIAGEMGCAEATIRNYLKE